MPRRAWGMTGNHAEMESDMLAPYVFIFLPVATVTAAGLTVGAILRSDDELAQHCALYMAAYALLNVACWFVL
jgi:hypothetical protein